MKIVLASDLLDLLIRKVSTRKHTSHVAMSLALSNKWLDQTIWFKSFS